MEKYFFHQPSIGVFGHTILKDGVFMESKKIKTFTKWRQPSSTIDVQKFLDFPNFE
jgi:hypothetical protein